MDLTTFSNGGSAAIPVDALSSDQDLARDVQGRLEALGLLDPPVDGAFGRVSRWALREFCERAGIAYEGALTASLAAALITQQVDALFPLIPGPDLAGRIVRAMIAKQYWLSRHPDCLTIVYIEGMNPDGTPNANTPNHFNDARLLLRVGADGRPTVVKAWEGTTEPGKQPPGTPIEPKGIARIAFDQYKSWRLGLYHVGDAKNEHEALLQRSPLTVYRDFNRDNQRIGDTIDTGNFGIHQHWGYNMSATNVANASAGCLLGRSTAGHLEFIAHLKADARYKANPDYMFMTAILPVTDL